MNVGNLYGVSKNCETGRGYNAYMQLIWYLWAYVYLGRYASKKIKGPFEGARGTCWD